MNLLEKTIHNLGHKRTIRHNEQLLKLVCLIRTEDRRPFQADWYKGKESYLIGVDENGHFFLRDSGGSVFKLDPLTQEKEHMARSETNFLNNIEWDEPETFIQK